MATRKGIMRFEAPEGLIRVTRDGEPVFEAKVAADETTLGGLRLIKTAVQQAYNVREASKRGRKPKDEAARQV